MRGWPGCPTFPWREPRPSDRSASEGDGPTSTNRPDRDAVPAQGSQDRGGVRADFGCDRRRSGLLIPGGQPLSIGERRVQVEDRRVMFELGDTLTFQRFADGRLCTLQLARNLLDRTTSITPLVPQPPA